MGSDEPVRVLLRDGIAHTGRVAQLHRDATERDGTALALELDSGDRVHRADVSSIGPATRPARPPARRGLRLADCAHAFGYRGHCRTKSRRYSTTFKALRAAREAFVHEQILARSTDATQRAIAAAETRTATFEFAGSGHVTAADALLAASAAARAREQRFAARLARDMEFEAGG
ncbi:MAG TPA: replication initiator [Solirubrobacter sp.]|nr:replication initiator [Solirubrobacter sp.]